MSHKQTEMSQTSSTGGTGGTGSPAPPNVITESVGSQDALKFLSDSGQTVDAFAKSAAYQGLVGATGGKGQIPPTIEQAMAQNVGAADMRKVLVESIASKTDVKVIIEEVQTLYSEFNVLQDKANSFLAFHAFRIGLYLLKLQALRYGQNLRDWSTWASRHLVFIKKRSREKYMNLASLPMVEEHLWLGIERLAAVGTHYSSLNDADRDVLGNDPISSLLKKQGFREDMTFEERKARADAIIEVYKLERMGVTIDPGLMERFLANQDPLTAEERKFLKKLAEEQDKSAPSELLTNVSTQQVKRSDFIPKQDDTAATQQNGEAAAEGQAEAPETSLPNVDTLLARASESIKPYVHQGLKLKGKVDLNLVDRLIADLVAFKKVIESSSAA